MSAAQVDVSPELRLGPQFSEGEALATSSRCPLCHSTQTRIAFRDNGCLLRVCRHCDLFFISPYPASEKQHNRVASNSQAEIATLDCSRRYEGERLYYDRHFPPIAEECEGAESLLDVGCGTGNLLERFGSRSRLHREGVELNPHAAEFARRVANCKITEVPFEYFKAVRRFDAITLINVFSHIPSFDGLFQSLRQALSPGGKVVLRTTEMSPCVHRWNQMHWGIPDDLHFLGLRTLDLLAAKYGFVITRRVRTPFEDELFLPSRWRQMGRNTATNRLKSAGLRAPLALSFLKKFYTQMVGGRLFLSFVVLKPLPREADKYRERLRAHG